MKQGWEIKKLGEVIHKTETVDPSKRPDSEFLYVDVSSVNNQGFFVESTSTLKGKDAPSRARKLIRTNDVIFATVRPTLKRVAIIEDDLDEQVCSTGYFVLRAKDIINYKLLFYYLLTDGFIAKMESLQKGASYPAVTDSEVRNQTINYPKSLSEQQRIVSILDEAFAAIDKAKTNAEQNLRNAKELFESYLHGVFEGKGEGWEERRLGDLCSIGDGNYSSKYPKASEFVSDGVPFLTATNLKNGTVVTDGIRFISKEQHSTLTKGHIIKNDLVVVVRGSSTGNNSIVPKEYAGSNLNSQLAFLRVKENKLSSEYLFAVFNSSTVMKTIKSTISGAAQPQLPNNKLLDIKISYPNIKEQQTIVQRLDILSTETKKLEAIYQQKINDLEEMKKSILQKAFAGELKTEKPITV